MKRKSYKLSAWNLSIGSLADKARTIFFLLLSFKCLGGVGQSLLHHLLITPSVFGGALTRYYSAVPSLRGDKWPLVGYLCVVAVSCVLQSLLLCLSAVTGSDGVVNLQCRNVAQVFPFPFALQNPAQFGESDCDSSEGECSDATVRTNKPCSSATW